MVRADREVGGAAGPNRFYFVIPMNVEEKALSMFRAEPYCYNCAQTVCAALGRHDLVPVMSACSGGRAPEGMCGALYGVLLCSPESLRPAMTDVFRQKCGYLTCRELKKEGRVPCVECVRAAAGLAAVLGL